jgi:uncharacterized protein YndB with AHSA1/START domain
MTPRPTGRTKDAGWQIGVSRTIAVDLDTAWDYLVSPRGLARWLGTGVTTPLATRQTYLTDNGTTGEIRSVRHRDRVRITWQPADRSRPATVQIALAPAAHGTTFRFHTERLDSGEEREAMRAHWRRIADIVQSDLTDDDS